ncbi:MAG: hypothetical protein H6Q04_1708 [Acidobacteria bacterium]|nr:hypothetical protein [Acidobacteriota bacterium]
MSKALLDPLVGTWKLNGATTKITGTGSADKSATGKIESQENGFKLIYDGLDSVGKATHFEYSAKYDGKDYPIKGNPAFDTVSLQKIDNNTQDRLYKKGGKEVISEHAAISKDGRTGTVTQKGKDAKGQGFTVVTVWEKQ